jgi:acetyltransferase-like isoleucine patch superfamily enzyme
MKEPIPAPRELALAALRVAWRLRRFRPWRAAYRLEINASEVEGRVWLPGPGPVRIGDRVRLDARHAAIELRAHAGGEIIIEDGVLIERGTSVEATASVRIGEGARIGPFCKIIDNHFHRLDERFARPPPIPISIGPHAVVGARAVLLPGAELGAAASVAPGAVLSFRVPPGVAFRGTTSAPPQRR